MPSSLLEQLRARMAATQEAGGTPSLLDELRAKVAAQPSPGLFEQFTSSAANSLRDILTFPNIGSAGPESAEDRPDLMALSAKAGVPSSAMLLGMGEKIALPEAQGYGEKATRLAGAAIPYLAAGAVTAPLSATGEAAAAKVGLGKLGQVVTGQLAQEAAFVPSTIASSDSLGEAAVRTGVGVGVGSILGRLFMGKGTAQAAEQTFSQEAAGRALARMRHSLETGAPLRSGDLIEMGDDVAEQLAKDVRQEALRKGVAAIRAVGGTDREVANISTQLKGAMRDLDPTTAGIVSDTVSTLPSGAASKFVRSAGGGFRDKVATLGAQIREFRAASMLSGFGTHARNLIGNTLNVVMKPARTMGSALADLPLAAVTKSRQRYFSEAAAESAGQIWSMARSLPGALKQAGIEARAVRETLDQGAIPGMTGTIIRTPLRLLNKADRFFFDRVFAGEMFRRAARQAASEGVDLLKAPKRIGEILGEQDAIVQQVAKLNERIGRAENLLAQAPASLTAKNKKALVGFIGRTQEEIAALQSKSFVKDAAGMADRTIFTAREGETLDKLLDQVDEASKLVPVIDLVLPFRRTPANIARETLRSSPVGFLTGASRAIQSAAQNIPAGQIQGRLADDLGQAIIGTSALYTLLHMASSGNIKVNPFKEKARAERVTEEAAGVVPDSVQIGDWSIPVSRLEPIGSMLLAAGRVAEMREGENPPAGLTEELEQMATILGTQGLNEAFMDPLAEFFEATTGDDRTMARWAQGLGGSFVPRAISQFNTKIKEPATGKESGLPGLLGEAASGAQRQIPGKGQADLGLFGKEREVQAPLLSMIVGRAGEANNPIAQEMTRVSAYHLPPSGLSNDFKAMLAKRGVAYSDAEDRTMRMTKGRVQEQAVTAVIQSPRYQSLPAGPAGDAVRKQLIDQAFTRASKLVDERVKSLKLARVPLTERLILGR